MQTSLIEDLAYKLKKSKDQERGAIVFLGAGASFTANIPLAGKIITDVLDRFGDSPKIKRLGAEDKKNYFKVMESIDPDDRKTLFKEYIGQAKINVAHIYLAHLMEEGYVDYILTVNFDNLAQRALSLFNMFPAVYDIAVLKGLNTSTFDHPGIVHLHGQHQGINLLNTEVEFEEAKGLIMPSLERICDRPWIIVGYSGEDPMLDYISGLGRFDKGLYWACYKENNPSERVCSRLLNKKNTNCSLIKGYDADSFFLNLHREIGLKQPKVLDQPFSYLASLHDSIVDIDGDEYKSVQERLDITKKWIREAQVGFENGEGFNNRGVENHEAIQVDVLRKELINSVISGNYDRLIAVEDQYGDGREYADILSWGYSYWGMDIAQKASNRTRNERETYILDSIGKYKRAIELNPNNSDAYNGWGWRLYEMADIKEAHEKKQLLLESIDKYKKAIELSHDSPSYNAWGISLWALARIAQGEEQNGLLLASIEKYKRAIEILPSSAKYYSNLSISLRDLVQISGENDKKNLLMDCIESSRKAIELDNENADYHARLGNCLKEVARIVEGREKETRFLESIECYKKAIEINPNHAESYNNWSIVLSDLAKITQEDDREVLILESIEKGKKSITLDPNNGNYHHNLSICLNELAELKPVPMEREWLIKQAIENGKKAIELNPENAPFYNNCAILFSYLYKSVNVNDRQHFGEQMLAMALKAFQLSGSSYNLACAYALIGDDSNAFVYLEKVLSENEHSFDKVRNDEDWNNLRTHKRYLELEEKYNSARLPSLAG